MKFGKDPSTGGKFLKIDPDKSVVGVLRGEPLEYYVKKTGMNKFENCEESDPGATFRFKINIIIKQPDLQYKAFIWEQSATVYNILKKFNEEFPLEQTIIKISREGAGLKTKYSILPAGKNFSVTPELEGLLKDVKLHELKVENDSDPGEKQEFPEEHPQQFPDDEIPF